MKKLFKNSYIALAVLALGFSACTEQVEYTPAEVPATDQVYFSNANATKMDIAIDATSFDVYVSRIATDKAASVAVTVNADSLANAWFEFPETIEFAENDTVVAYNVALKDGAVLEYSNYCNISLEIADETITTPYGNSTFTFQVGVPAPWGEWEKLEGGVYNFSLYVGGSYAIPVYYREHMIDNTKAQFLFGTTAIGTNSDIVVDYNKATGNCEVPAAQYFLDNETYGPVFVSDLVHYPFVIKDDDGNPIEMTYDEYPCTFDSEKGLFTLNLIYYVDASLGSAASGYFAKGEETVQLNGYYIPDYSVKLAYKGNYVDETGLNNAVISAVKGVDVAQYLMTVVGADADVNATIQGMLAGTVACDTLTEGGFYAYPMTESGNYRALAITFDAEGSPIELATADFEFWLAGDSNPWESLGYAVYTDDLVLPLFGNPAMPYYVEVLENKDEPGLFRMVDPYGPEFPLYPYASSYEAGSYIEIDATDPEGVWIEGWQSTGCDIANNGLMTVTSMAWYQANAQGATKEDAKAAGLCGVYADGVITFPVQGLLVGLGGKAYYGNKNGAFALDMTNLLEALPEEGGAASAPAARVNLEVKGDVMGKVTNFKKIDNSFLTLKTVIE